MTQHTTVHGITVALITEEQICQAWDNIDSDWPKGQYQQLRRYVKDTLHDCAVLAGHYEDAARTRAKAQQELRVHADGTDCDSACERSHYSIPNPEYRGCNTERDCTQMPWCRINDACQRALSHDMGIPLPSSSPSQLDHSNGSARHNGQSETASAVHAKAMHKLAANLICPPAADDEPERLRKAGAL